MRLTRIEIESDDKDRFAVVRRQGAYMLATLFSPDAPNGRKHWIGADDEDDIRSAAELLFCFLEGHDGTNSDIHDMYLRLLPLSDI